MVCLLRGLQVSRAMLGMGGWVHVFWVQQQVAGIAQYMRCTGLRHVRIHSGPAALQTSVVLLHVLFLSTKYFANACKSRSAQQQHTLFIYNCDQCCVVNAVLR